MALCQMHDQAYDYACAKCENLLHTRNIPFTLSKLCSMSVSGHLFLQFKHGGRTYIVQDSHLTDAELLSVPGFASSVWRYSWTIHEDIHLFMYEDRRPITDFVDIADSDASGALVTPKGFPCDRPSKFV